MTDLEVLQSNIKVIDSASNMAFKLAEKMFKGLDKGEATTELKLLTNMGAEIAAIKICYNKLNSQLELLKELLDEKTDTGN